MAEELQLTVDPSSDVPLYRQIVDHVWVKVASGILEPGNRLPTVRQVAIDLGVHLDTVERAYRELELLGVVVQHPGEGTFVGLRPPQKDEANRRAQLERVCHQAISQTQALGFSIDDLMEVLAEFRSPGRTRDPGGQND